MRRLLVISTLVLLVAPAGAEAAGFKVRGGGYGDGVGMSQYGAQGFAQQGRGYRAILRHYYQDTRLDEMGGRRVRVLLQASHPELASFSNAVRVGRKTVDPGRTHTVRAARSGKLVVRAEGAGRIGRFESPLKVRGEGAIVQLGGTALNEVTGGRYRGRMEFRPGLSGGVTAINDVGIDDYVRGVIAAEMPASWHQEALKAQAVAARSYAIATDKGSAIFDHYPDTRSQVYRGVQAEEPSTDHATAATAREVVTYNGSVATTYFFSASGGHTENVENVFGGSRVPYLRGVSDPHDDISPLHRWSYRYSRRELEAKLGSLVQGRLRRVRVVERGVSRRIVTARIVGSEGSTTASGSTLRSGLGTPGTPRSIRRVRR
ncbi:MAG TPA: SpoIID/LytB domain-containing protein [Thermoleophilaceae bacterium]|nr:SpoIID/LytB domain-containing protein [Thermoleophilaceae bacterium]